MEATRQPRVKICCIRNREEAWTAIRSGASALGLVSEMPSGPGVIAPAMIAEIAAIVPPGISSFLLTCKQDSADLIAQQRESRVNVIQICDRLLTGSYDDLHAALPGVSIVQVIHITGEESIKEALSIAPRVNGLLLDSGKPSLRVKELGGTGRTHDWGISRKIRESAGIPVYLAGGLTPENVADAIREVGPFGVDVCSGVRTDGVLDERKLSHFFRQVASAYSGPSQ